MPKQFRLRAVFFDAVGTLIHPDPPFATVYDEVGRRFGSRLGMELILRAFRIAFERQETLDREAGWRTSETREIERWRSIVSEVMRDAFDKEACFTALYEHFARPCHWRCDPAAAEVFAALEERDLRIGMASNFDSRLRKVIAGFPALGGLRNVVISSEVGWRKPAAEFFTAMSESLGVAPKEILYLGDDLRNDYDGAAASGCQVLLFDPCRKAAPGYRTVQSLTEVPFFNS